MELRERVIKAYHRGDGSQRLLSERFSISRATLELWLKRERETGSLTPSPPGGGNVSRVDMKRLHSIIEAQPDASTVEITAVYNRRTKKRKFKVHRSSIVRAIERAGFVFKKNGTWRQSSYAQMYRKNDGNLSNS